jgi:hypothetical protein
MQKHSLLIACRFHGHSMLFCKGAQKVFIGHEQTENWSIESREAVARLQKYRCLSRLSMQYTFASGCPSEGEVGCDALSTEMPSSLLQV